jgi:hypothetical protein
MSIESELLHEFLVIIITIGTWEIVKRLIKLFLKKVFK